MMRVARLLASVWTIYQPFGVSSKPASFIIRSQ
jgi:hypothetical protein